MNEKGKNQKSTLNNKTKKGKNPQNVCVCERERGEREGGRER